MNYINAGDDFRHTLTGAVSKGGVYEGGNAAIGVYQQDGVSGETVVVARRGQFVLAALSTDTWAALDQLYWDATNDRLTDTAAGNIPAGVAMNAKGAGETTARVEIG